jgi:hypothetical protein
VSLELECQGLRRDRRANPDIVGVARNTVTDGCGTALTVKIVPLVVQICLYINRCLDN